jgi:hypothetical protein
MAPLPSDQKSVCEKYGAQYVPCDANHKLGISKNFAPKNFPINGLRHPLTKGATGWYIWSGEEFSLEPDFFLPVHVAHLNEQCVEIVKYLGLPPGWRFLFAPSQEDVWFDEKLLQT